MHVFDVQAFAKEGAQVTATDINGEKLKELEGIEGTEGLRLLSAG